LKTTRARARSAREHREVRRPITRRTPRQAELPVPALCGRTDHGLLRARYLHSLLQPDCSVLRIVYLTLPTDLTRRSTLNALRRSWIAPLSTLCARAARGSLRDQHLKLCSACGLLRSRCLVRHAFLRLLFGWRSSPRIVHGLLRAQYLTFHAGLRIAPYSNTSRPCGAHGLLRVHHFKLRTVTNYFVLDAWRALLTADCSAFFTLRPVLTADFSVFSTWSFASNPDCSLIDTYRSAPYPDYSAYDT